MLKCYQWNTKTIDFNVFTVYLNMSHTAKKKNVWKPIGVQILSYIDDLWLEFCIGFLFFGHYSQHTVSSKLKFSVDQLYLAESIRLFDFCLSNVYEHVVRMLDFEEWDRIIDYFNEASVSSHWVL